MRSLILRGILTFALIGCFAAQAFAMVGRPKSIQITGKVIEVNLRASTVKVIPNKGEPILVQFNEKTTLIKSGKAITPVVLKKGDLVIVNYERRWGKNIALSIKVQEPPPAPKKMEPKKKR